MIKVHVSRVRSMSCAVDLSYTSMSARIRNSDALDPALQTRSVDQRSIHIPLGDIQGVPTGGYANAAPNEANQRGASRDSTRASRCSLQWKACRRPLRQNHVVCPGAIGEES